MWQQLNHLVAQGIVADYPPLCDVRGSMTAQFVGGQQSGRARQLKKIFILGTHDPTAANSEGSSESWRGLLGFHVINNKLNEDDVMSRGEERSRKSLNSTSINISYTVAVHHVPIHPYLTCCLHSTRQLPFFLTHEHVSTLASLPLLRNQSRQPSRESHLYAQKALTNLLPPSFLRDSRHTTTIVARGPSPSAEGRTRYGHTRCAQFGWSDCPQR
jgi:hypothetical protein